MGAIIAAILAFAVGIFILWVLVYASGLVRPKVKTETGVTGAPAMERKVLLSTAGILATFIWLTGYTFWDPARQGTARERQLDVAIERGAHNYATLCYSCHGEDGKGATVPDPAWNPPRVGALLNDQKFWSDDPDEYKKNYDLVYKTLQRGRPGTPMPAWGQTDGGTLNQEQLYELTMLILYGDRVFKGHTAWEHVQEYVAENVAHGAPTAIPVSVALEAGMPDEFRPGLQVFASNGCAACHPVAGTQNGTGPNLSGLSQRAAQRKPGTSAEDYVRESIRASTAFVVPGFQPIMPSFSPTQIPDEQLDQLIRYLLYLP